MPGWIAWQTGLTSKREILVISNRLGVSRREAAAMCMEAWEWADANTSDGRVEGVTAVQLSDSMSLPGLGEAMVSVGWIAEDRSGLMFINFDRWNGETAKRRMQKAKWIARKRHEAGEDGIGAKKRRIAGL